MCHSCRAMRPGDRPTTEWRTVTCQECGKPMQVPPKATKTRCEECSRCAWSPGRNGGRCAMLKPPSKTTCEWFSVTPNRTPRAAVAYASR